MSLEKIKIKPLEEQKKLSEQMLRDTEAMLRLRFSGTDWTERFAEFRAENERRQGK